MAFKIDHKNDKISLQVLYELCYNGICQRSMNKVFNAYRAPYDHYMNAIGVYKALQISSITVGLLKRGLIKKFSRLIQGWAMLDIARLYLSLRILIYNADYCGLKSRSVIYNICIA